MNNKKLLATVGVLFASAIAATSGTLAWFTTVRNASVKYGNATIYNASSDLVIEYKGSLNTIAAPTASGNNLTFSVASGVTDVSGDGLDLYKPIWASQESHDDGIVQRIDQVLATDSVTKVGSLVNAAYSNEYFVDFTVTLSRDEESVGYKVFLGTNTAITPKTATGDAAQQAKNDGIIDSVRMAVIDDAGDVVIRYAPTSETDPHYIIADEDAEDEIYEIDGFNVEGDALLSSVAFATAENIDDAEDNYPAIADLSTVEEADVTFRLWVEGEDVDAINDYVGGVFNIALDIYALSA